MLLSSSCPRLSMWSLFGIVLSAVSIKGRSAVACRIAVVSVARRAIYCDNEPNRLGTLRSGVVSASGSICSRPTSY